MSQYNGGTGPTWAMVSECNKLTAMIGYTDIHDAIGPSLWNHSKAEFMAFESFFRMVEWFRDDSPACGSFPKRRKNLDHQSLKVAVENLPTLPREYSLSPFGRIIR